MDEKYYIDDIWYENIILHFCPKYLLLFPLEDIEREEIRGTQGNDYIAGTDGHDLMTGLQGDDTLLGSPGWDEFRGGYGNDIVDYSASKCAVDVSLERGYGIGGDAHGDTYQGIESVWGSEAGDTLVGDNKDNTLEGGAGHDLIEGRGGDDYLRGGYATVASNNNDTLRGGDGDDTLYGVKGDNLLTGGAGADTFIFFFVDTVTTITDFTPGTDVVEMNGFLGYAEFMAEAQQVGNDVVYSRENDYLNYVATIVLENVVLADLTEDDLVF